ncbi:MAG TPA: Zn-ribbon domain-containing OB-fold protein [Firmicutes bacterium]|nr:Zn-ribbon domain-containing OB-fold protein [Bacillota bacterium]
MGAHVSVPMYQRTVPQRYRLQGLRCRHCGTVIFPPRAVCPACRGAELEPYPLSGRGKIYSFTVIQAGGAPPEFAAQAEALGSYAVALIDLEEGPRVIAQMTGCDPASLRLGIPVEAVFRRVYVQEDVIRYGYKFRPCRWPSVHDQDGKEERV